MAHGGGSSYGDGSAASPGNANLCAAASQPGAPQRPRNVSREENLNISGSEASYGSPQSSASEMAETVMYRAAAALIEQHHCYSKAALLEYLARNHPMVEPEQRLPLLIGAVTGAQAAARLHVFTLLNKDSTGDEGKKLTANASRALSY